MELKRRFFLRQALALGTVAAAWHGGPMAFARSISPSPLFGQTLPDAQGREFGLETFMGKPVVVNFWATWCAPCVREMPELEALHKKYTAVNFIGIGIDTASNIRSFSEKVKVSYPVLVAGHGGIQLMRDLGNKVGGLPFTVVFDAQGRSVNTTLGQISSATLERTLMEVQN